MQSIQFEVEAGAAEIAPPMIGVGGMRRGGIQSIQVEVKVGAAQIAPPHPRNGVGGMRMGAYRALSSRGEARQPPQPP